MLEALIVTLREGLEAALVIGLILAYLRKIGRPNLSSFVYTGLVLALIASAMGAFLFQTFNIQEEQADIVEAYIMLAGALFVGTMIAWMFRASRNLRRQLEQRVDITLRKETIFAQGLSLLLLAFLMVFREGVETILFLAALSLRSGSNPFAVVSGGVAGIAIAGILGVLIMKGLVRINLRLFFAGTGAVLLVLVGTLIAKAIHNLAEFNVVQLTPDELSFIGLLIRDDTSILILVSLIAVPAILITVDPVLRSSATEPSGYESPAQRRLRTADIRRRRFLQGLMGGLLYIVTMAVGFSWAQSARGGYDPQVIQLTPQGGQIVLPLSKLENGLMSKFSVQVEGTLVRFFILQLNGIVKVALDACYICPPVGYYQKADTVVCKNCDAPINFDTIGLPGGCNPRTLKFTVDGSNVIIELAALASSAEYFTKS